MANVIQWFQQLTLCFSLGLLMHKVCNVYCRAECTMELELHWNANRNR